MIKHWKDHWYKGNFEDAFNYVRGIPGWHCRGSDIVVPSNLLGLVPDLAKEQLIGYPNPFSFDKVTEPLGWKLRPYQHQGRIFIEQNRGTLLADVMRLGKTPQIVSAHNANDGRLLVVGPLMTWPVWLTWFKRRWPNGKFAALKGRRADMKELSKYDALFINYEILASWANTYNLVHTMVFDEAHLLSNPKTKRVQAAIMFATQAKKVVLATGTPLWNKPANVHSLLDLIEPGGWGKYWDFARRYASGRMGTWGFETGEPSHEEEFQKRLNMVMLRRTWEDVAGELPATTRSVEFVELTVEQKYEIERDLEIKGSDTRTLIGDQSRLREGLSRVVKGPTCVNLATQILDSNERVVLWTWHTKLAEELNVRLSGQGYTSFVVTGETTEKKRNSTLDLWRQTPASALIITLGVGQAGIDLSASSHAIFAEVDYTPAVMSQAEMRTFSSERPMNVTYVISDHPIEMAIVKTLMRKCRMAAQTGLPTAETAVDLLGQALGDDMVLDGAIDDLVLSLFEE